MKWIFKKDFITVMNCVKVMNCVRMAVCDSESATKQTMIVAMKREET